MEPRISFVTLGVGNLDRSVGFYEESLGLPRLKSPPTVAFFELGRTWLALYPRHLLAADAGVPAEGSGFSGVVLAHNVRSVPEVDGSSRPVTLRIGVDIRGTLPIPTGFCGKSPGIRAFPMSKFLLSGRRIP
jgi:catechol 2,3-dioxygenase-like lactoylglutathione lyase family enzyme